MEKRRGRILQCLLLVICIVVCVYTITTKKGVDSNIPAITQAPISRYFGSNRTDTDLFIYDFQVIQGGIPEIQITFKNYLDDTIFQTLSYELREDFMPETVMDGIEIIDANGDGNDDFLFDLGVYGKMRIKACLVYDDEKKQYVFVKGFEDLNSPIFLNGYFLTTRMPMDITMTIERYLLEENMLCHVGSLSIFQDEAQTLYTESERVNGEWVKKKNMVTEKNIDLSNWGISPER